MLPNHPAGDEIDRQWETVHFDKERDDKSGKGAERAPVPFRFRLGEGQRKNDEDR